MLVFENLGREYQRLDETMPGHCQALERFPALLEPRVLACLSASCIPQVIGRFPLALMHFRLCRLPEVHPRARYFKVLVRIEDPLCVLGTGHVHDPEAESMPALIPQYLRQYDCPKWEKGLTEFVVGAKVGQPADVDVGTHIEPSR
jgi:hypothetical protein